MKTDVHFLSYLAQFFLERKTFRTNVVQKIKTHIVSSRTFFSGNYSAYEKMWKNYYSAEPATDDSMANALCTLST